MRSRTLLGVLSVALVGWLPAGADAAPGAPPEGERCGFLSVSGTDQESPDTFAGAVYGGPLAAPGSAVSITCSITVNGGRHTDPPAVSETAGPAADTVVLAPAAMSYVAEEWDVVHLCTAAAVDGTAWYWDAGTEAWSADPASACTASIDVGVPEDPYLCHGLLLECVFDAVGCPALASLPSVPGVAEFGPDGDVAVAGEPFWDCPPYQPWQARSAAPQPYGEPCAFTATNAGADPGEAWTGELHGGPLLAPGVVSLRCSIHAGNAAHSGPAVAAATAGPAERAVVLAPEPVSYAAPADPGHVVCTEATVDGTTWYWTGSYWTTDAGATCPAPGGPELPASWLWDWFTCLERSFCTPDFLLDHLPDDPAFDPVRDAARCAWAATYCPMICALTSGAPDVPGVLEFRDDGDVWLLGELFWDCPPYA